MTPVPFLSQALSGFYLSRRADGYSPDTLAQYDWALSRWVKFIGDKPLPDVSTNDARRFLASVQEGNLSPQSIYHVWKSVRAFYKWASPEFNLPNIAAGLRAPRYEAKEITPLTSADIDRLLKAADTIEVRGKYKPRFAARNRLILLFLLDTGVRVGELCRINAEDVNLETCEIKIRPFRSSIKSRPRTVYIGKRVQKELWRYLLNRTLGSDPLFLNAQDKRLTPDSVKHILVRIGKRAGVHVHPHALRHMFALMYIRRGDVFTLQKLLGHSSLEMVKHYIALSKADVESAYRKASPVDNL